MKKVFAALTMTILAACGQTEIKSHVASQVPTVNFGFKQDLRKAGGTFTQLFIKKNRGSSKYTVTIETTNSISVLANDFSCKIVSSLAGVNRIDCSSDRRQTFAGSLHKISVVKTSNNGYTAIQTSTSYDRDLGEESTYDRVIGHSMTSFYVPQAL